MAGINFNNYTAIAFKTKIEFKKSLLQAYKDCFVLRYDNTKKGPDKIETFPFEALPFRRGLGGVYFLATNFTPISKLSSIALSPMLSKKDFEP